MQIYNIQCTDIDLFTFHLVWINVIRKSNLPFQQVSVILYHYWPTMHLPVLFYLHRHTSICTQTYAFIYWNSNNLTVIYFYYHSKIWLSVILYQSLVISEWARKKTVLMLQMSTGQINTLNWDTTQYSFSTGGTPNILVLLSSSTNILEQKTPFYDDECKRTHSHHDQRVQECTHCEYWQDSVATIPASLYLSSSLLSTTLFFITFTIMPLQFDTNGWVQEGNITNKKFTEPCRTALDPVRPHTTSDSMQP